MEEGGIGTTPTQVLTPNERHVATPHNAIERVVTTSGPIADAMKPTRTATTQTEPAV